MDTEAIEIYEQHAEELMRFASTVAHPSVAEDIVATVVARVLVADDRWRSIDDVGAYLSRSVMNEAISRHRSQRRRQRREDIHVREIVSATSGEHVRVDVIDGVAKLTERQRGVVYLTYWLDRSAEEVATELDMSVRTVQRELTAARKRLEVLLR